ncbi:hypothetical protein B0H13DRAFT_1874241 [Mycena leptocephala]|nr:hypothetical protein B0H13DRAFT_1874241 [Mycena leptocephala]
MTAFHFLKKIQPNSHAVKKFTIDDESLASYWSRRHDLPDKIVAFMKQLSDEKPPSDQLSLPKLEYVVQNSEPLQHDQTGDVSDFLRKPTDLYSLGRCIDSHTGTSWLHDASKVIITTSEEFWGDQNNMKRLAYSTNGPPWGEADLNSERKVHSVFLDQPLYKSSHSNGRPVTDKHTPPKLKLLMMQSTGLTLGGTVLPILRSSSLAIVRSSSSARPRHICGVGGVRAHRVPYIAGLPTPMDTDKWIHGWSKTIHTFYTRISSGRE